MKTRLALFALALLAAPVALAAGPKHNVTGAWSFKTQQYDGGCVMTGQLTVERKAKGAAHVCKITAHETCPGISIKADQNCTLTERDGKVRIASTIVKVEPALGYTPDDFELRLESSSRMIGELRSADVAPVMFYRGDTPIS
jgi:hypothetical protein